MTQDIRQRHKEDFQFLGGTLIQDLKPHEALTLSYLGEESVFARITQAKIRQASEVMQRGVTLNFISENRHTEMAFSVTGNREEDLKRAQKMLALCREECSALPEDPYLVRPQEGEASEENHKGKLLSLDKIAETLLQPAQGNDLVGLYGSGIFMRGTMNSRDQFHWFSTENFYFDYSLYTASQKAVKSTYAGNTWDEGAYHASLRQAQNHLKILETPQKTLSPGNYRVYLAPSATAEILSGLAWSGLSESHLRQGRSSLKQLADGEKTLSPLVTLEEDFSQGLVPRFNELGEVSPHKIPLITKGNLVSMLVSKRTAHEYNLSSNAANAQEMPRSLRLAAGALKQSEILSRLNTGLYISNLHYLNWSDLQHGRITGMTRYACFWVEEGKPVAPIQDMRFDDTLYNIFGSNLEEISDTADIIPNLSSYGEQSLGGMATPGLLLKSFALTL